jgi:hypothetical protein
MPEGGEDLEYEAELYQAQSQELLENNYGILIYWQGRLVNRFDCSFGDFFKENFYKTKFKTARTIFLHLGVINVKKGLTLNYLGTWFKKRQGYYLFLEKVRTAMRGGTGEREEKGGAGEQE